MNDSEVIKLERLAIAVKNKTGQSVRECAVLMMIAAGTDRTATDIGAELYSGEHGNKSIPSQLIAPAINSLIVKELIKDTESKADRRVKLMSLTPEGWTRLDQIRDELKTVEGS